MSPHSGGRAENLGLADFARLLGTNSGSISEPARSLIGEYDFRFRPLNPQQAEETMLAVWKRINSPELTVAGDKEAQGRWERGWRENLAAFKRSHNSVRLVPKYVRRGQTLRLFGRYVKPLDWNFELHWFNVLRNWLFETYLKNVDAVYEFGCGTGYNLLALARMFPEKCLYGLDWSRSSVETVNLLSKVYGLKLIGHKFDMAAPDNSFGIKRNSAVITFTALEQMGNRYGSFLRFVARRKPAICVHVEPVVEWYDTKTLFDYLALAYHKRRHYLEGFVPELMRLETEGRLKLTKLNRCRFGSLYTDSYSQIIWKPN